MWNFRAGDYSNNHLIHIPHLRGEIKSKMFIDLPNTIERAKTVLELKSMPTTKLLSADLSILDISYIQTHTKRLFVTDFFHSLEGKL